jgi:hypothetical protein
MLKGAKIESGEGLSESKRKLLKSGFYTPILTSQLQAIPSPTWSPAAE